jgi:hypothetical protein
MPDFADFECKQVPLPKQRALQVGPIRGVLPFAGHRNPLTRSNTARKVSMALPTAATNGVPRVYHFDSAAEAAVALDVLLDPEIYGLEVQLPAIPYFCSTSKKTRHHSFDLRLTFRDGFRRVVFVRNRQSLKKPKTQVEIDDIFRSIPPDFADDSVPVDGDDYTRDYRDNLFRLWHCVRKSDPVADAHVAEMAQRVPYWFLKDLIKQCDLYPARAWQAAMRLIARRVLYVDWYTIISVHSKVRLNT